jgi:hypothetical protein
VFLIRSVTFLGICEDILELVLSIILARPVTILSVVREITRIQLESDQECAKGLLYHTMNVFGKLHLKDTIQQFRTTSIYWIVSENIH